VCTTFPKLARNISIQWPHTRLTTIYTRSCAALHGWDPPPQRCMRYLCSPLWPIQYMFSNPWPTYAARSLPQYISAFATRVLQSTYVCVQGERSWARIFKRLRTPDINSDWFQKTLSSYTITRPSELCLPSSGTVVWLIPNGISYQKRVSHAD
jgi:hypothetical protein